jgi:hypothetical protein
MDADFVGDLHDFSGDNFLIDEGEKRRRDKADSFEMKTLDPASMDSAAPEWYRITALTTNKNDKVRYGKGKPSVGYVGKTKNGTYKANISVDREKIHIGTFAAEEEAREALAKYKRENGINGTNKDD